MVDVIMPPTIGAAIGFITSEPMPDSHNIGARLKTKELRDICEIEAEARREFGDAVAEVLKHRLADLDAAISPNAVNNFPLVSVLLRRALGLAISRSTPLSSVAGPLLG